MRLDAQSALVMPVGMAPVDNALLVTNPQGSGARERPHGFDPVVRLDAIRNPLFHPAFLRARFDVGVFDQDFIFRQVEVLVQQMNPELGLSSVADENVPDGIEHGMVIAGQPRHIRDVGKRSPLHGGKLDRVRHDVSPLWPEGLG